MPRFIASYVNANPHACEVELSHHIIEAEDIHEAQDIAHETMYAEHLYVFPLPIYFFAVMATRTPEGDPVYICVPDLDTALSHAETEEATEFVLYLHHRNTIQVSMQRWGLTSILVDDSTVEEIVRWKMIPV